MHLTHKFPDNFSPQDWYGIRNSTTSSAYIKQMHEILAAIEQPKKRIGPLKGMKHKYVLIFGNANSKALEKIDPSSKHFRKLSFLSQLSIVYNCCECDRFQDSLGNRYYVHKGSIASPLLPVIHYSNNRRFQRKLKKAKN